MIEQFSFCDVKRFERSNGTDRPTALWRYIRTYPYLLIAIDVFIVIMFTDLLLRDRAAVDRGGLDGHSPHSLDRDAERRRQYSCPRWLETWLQTETVSVQIINCKKIVVIFLAEVVSFSSAFSRHLRSPEWY